MILYLISGCAYPPPSMTTGASTVQLTEEDKEIIYMLADNAFFESRSEGLQNMAVQIYSTINRAHTMHNGDIKATIIEPWAYTWRYTIPRERKKELRDRYIELHAQAMEIAEDAYLNYDKGWNADNIITRNHDHYVTVKLANSGKAPRWFKYYCKNKVRVKSHIFCEGIRK